MQSSFSFFFILAEAYENIALLWISGKHAECKKKTPPGEKNALTKWWTKAKQSLSLSFCKEL